jgi:hypothetical protein
MNLTCLLILLLATSAMAYPDGSRHDRRNRGLPGNHRALKTASMGMGGRDMRPMKGMAARVVILPN